MHEHTHAHTHTHTRGDNGFQVPTNAAMHELPFHFGLIGPTRELSFNKNISDRSLLE